jgi:hypothetical protein
MVIDRPAPKGQGNFRRLGAGDRVEQRGDRPGDPEGMQDLA